MGMFDYVTVETDKLKGEFQTKSFYNYMEKYLVHEDKLYLYQRKQDKYYFIEWFSGYAQVNRLNKERQLEWFTLSFNEGKLIGILEGFHEEEY